MPITFNIASHPAEPVPVNPVTEAQKCAKVDDILQRIASQRRCKKSKEVLQSSLSTGKEYATDFDSIRYRSNGLVHTVVDAYNRHHNLVLRPDEVWMAILTQFNFYVNAHSKELRSTFVRHEGKKDLTVHAMGGRYNVDFGTMAKEMTDEIDKNLVDKNLKDWVLPNFSTTTDNDTIICAVLMMSTLKSYFSYKFSLMCGLPSVTLLGHKCDWESLFSRLDKLETFGNEPTAFATLLRPILRRFVNAFTRAEGNESPDIDFWSHICHYNSGGSGTDYLSGWITAFCVWDEKGKWMGPKLKVPWFSWKRRSLKLEPKREIILDSGWGEPQTTLTLVLDEIPYSFVDYDDVPPGYCEVDIKLDDNDEQMNCLMVAGLLGSVVEGDKKDTLKPLTAWIIYVPDQVEQPLS
ncbi:hypothetical protein CPB83DRAFT_885559 [Crepidotus variabilis]|uniref:Uncharacterized protein n=1 Tax=Crepidotus variabilis TaxID=179855 RepID=A0A9P6EAL8_9AGAR|nr:hypothetical protein CPB83DRAFT_885559 [Crepidotus variabilis]